jgi:hypothetical protein
MGSESVPTSVIHRMAATRAASTVVGMHTPDLAPSDRIARAPLVRTYVQRIEAAPEAVFPLLCPVREGEWLEGWAASCELIWSASGLAEPGCVFRTTEPDGPETIWIITEHDPDRGVVVFARVTPGLAASTLRIEVVTSDNRSSAVAIRYMVVPTSREGETYVAGRYDRHDLTDSVVWWERSMNHYLRTGQLLRRLRREPTSCVQASDPDDPGKE